MANLFGAASVLEGSQVVVLERDLELKCQPLDLTNHTQGNIVPYCQNHNPKDFEDGECPETCDKNITDTLERHLQTHLTGQGVRPLQTFTYFQDVIALSNINITLDYFPILIAAHIVMYEKIWTRTVCVKMHCFIFDT
jgi:hypothetical protein